MSINGCHRARVQQSGLRLDVRPRGVARRPRWDGRLRCAGLRERTLAPLVGWLLIAALPLTPVAGFLTSWYLPPGLSMGLLIAYALCALAGSGHPR